MGLMMLFTVLFSAFYISVETDHVCCGEDCPVCACIRQCDHTLRSIGDGSEASPAFAAVVILILFAAVFASTAVSYDTLVSEKVRLNN